MSERNLFFIGCVLALAALALGTAVALAWGGTLSGWLLALILALLLSGALIFGFTGAWRTLMPWLTCRPILGAMLVCLGVAIIWVPVTFVASAIVIGAGIRLVWLSACQLESQDGPAVWLRAARSTEVTRQNGAACEPAMARTETEVPDVCGKSAH